MKEKSLISEDEKARLKALQEAEKQQAEIERYKEKAAEYSRDISAGLYNNILPKDYEI